MRPSTSVGFIYQLSDNEVGNTDGAVLQSRVFFLYICSFIQSSIQRTELVLAARLLHLYISSHLFLASL